MATNNNSVYAFDADNNQGPNDEPLWQVNFNGPGVTPVPASDVNTLNSIRTPGPIGIMGTPVIDQATGTMYLVARTKETTGSTASYVQRLHALDISSGAEKFGGPVIINAASRVPVTTTSRVWSPSIRGPQNQRAGLALANGNVYIAWASYGDTDPYHGWIMAYNATTLQQSGVFCVTPDGQQAGIWQSGQPLSIDGSGNLYVGTGNGTFNGTRNFGESILKLNANLSSVLDWFTPDNWASLNTMDLDLGSAGVLLIPGTNDLIGGGKGGRFYVLDRSNLGHMQVGNGQIVQTFQVTGGASDHIHGAPAYWNGPGGPWVYVWGEQDELKSFAVQRLDLQHHAHQPIHLSGPAWDARRIPDDLGQRQSVRQWHPVGVDALRRGRESRDRLRGTARFRCDRSHPRAVEHPDDSSARRLRQFCQVRSADGRQRPGLRAELFQPAPRVWPARVHSARDRRRPRGQWHRVHGCRQFDDHRNLGLGELA